MNNIIKLIKLDKSLVKPYYKYYLIVLIIPLVTTFSYKNITSGIVFAMVMTAMTSNYTFSVTEKNDLNRLYGLLPVSKKDIVTGRYLFTALSGLLSLIIITLLNVIVLTISKIGFTIDEILFGIDFGIITYFLFTAVQLPGYFKFGAIKGRAFNFIPLLGLMVSGLIADKMKSAKAFSSSGLAFLNNTAGMLAIALLLAVVLYGISIGITQKIYDSMEL
jgi:hypothetical protein